MACENERTGYLPPHGGRPHFQDYGKGWIPVQLPCGKCVLCRKEQARQWATRISNEAQTYEKNCFVTLTYDEQHIPADGGLRKRDLQLFWKRLRDKVGKLRYYSVGEYGDKTGRPHYHACIFGHDFAEDRIIIREDPLLWIHWDLQNAWGQGQVAIGALTAETAEYVAGYVVKKLGDKKWWINEEGEVLEEPKALMSRNPGIGADWIARYGKHVYDVDRVIHGGNPAKPPRYYETWLAKNNPERLVEIKQERLEKGQAQEKDPEKTRARARGARARARNRRRSV